MRDTRAPTAYTLAGYCAVGAPLGIALCELRGLGVMGIWIDLGVGTLTTTLLTLARLGHRWRDGSMAS